MILPVGFSNIEISQPENLIPLPVGIQALMASSGLTMDKKAPKFSSICRKDLELRFLMSQ
jgi:hypothetical protein